MKQIFYLDKKISNSQIKKNVGLDYYSEIKLNNSNLGFILNNQKGFNVIKIKKLSEIENKLDVIVITSNLFYSNKKNYNLFLDRLNSIVINSFWGDKKSFVFKGKIATLINFINDNENLKLLKQTHPNCFYNLESIVQFKRLLSDNHDTRYFNDIKKTGEIITKSSKDKIKLKSEYDFLNNIPSALNEYYVEVFSFKERGNSSEYKMRAYDMLDLSYQSINNNLKKEDFVNFFNLIESFIRDSLAKKKYSKESQFDSIILKNSERMRSLKKLSFYNELNNFIINHKGISLNEHYFRIKKYLNKFKSKILKPNFIFSHGDLCFSNILFDKNTCNIRLIDPRGYTDFGMRTPYYDVAKLSHSFLGYYDLIINDISVIHFDKNMNASLKFDNNLILINLPNLILEMCNNLNLDYKIVRLIESSLFLSMLPLHSENKKKVFNLALRSIEIFEEIYDLDS